MHVCLKCGHLNRAGARFCGRCGYSLTAPDLPTAPMLQCDACGHMNRAGDEVCASCGSRLARPAVTAPLRGPRMGTGMLNPQTPLQGRYVIVRRIGQGGMGAVYEAADSRIPGKRWALKEMSDAALGSAQERAEAVAAFRQEAQVLATLSHPNLPAVVDFFSEGGKQYLVMEFVEGETLESKLAQAPGPLDQALVFDWALQLCDVLSYLHTRQPPVIFRDLKPANIMVGPAGHVKLVDFGIARFFKPGKRGDTQAMGTPGYAPPEQYGRAQTDSRSDVYSLGVTLHHLLTGRDPSWMPFQFAPVSDLNPAVPRAVADVIQRAVSQRPADRFASADEMRQALLAAGAPPPTARAVSWLTTGAMPLPLSLPPAAAAAPSVAPPLPREERSRPNLWHRLTSALPVPLPLLTVELPRGKASLDLGLIESGQVARAGFDILIDGKRGALDVEVRRFGDWLTVDPVGRLGELAAGQSRHITLSTAEGDGSGRILEGAVMVRSLRTTEERVVPVRAQMTRRPRLQVLPAELVQSGLRFDVRRGDSADQELLIYNGGGAELQFSVIARPLSGPSEWLRVECFPKNQCCLSGKHARVVVQVQGISAGLFQANLQVLAPPASPMEVTIPVILRVLEKQRRAHLRIVCPQQHLDSLRARGLADAIEAGFTVDVALSVLEDGCQIAGHGSVTTPSPQAWQSIRDQIQPLTLLDTQYGRQGLATLKLLGRSIYEKLLPGWLEIVLHDHALAPTTLTIQTNYYEMPWELTYVNGAFLGCQLGVGRRSLDQGDYRPMAAAGSRPRVLMVRCHRSAAGDAGRTAELSGIQRALAAVADVAEPLVNPSREIFLSEIGEETFDILHFTGHGFFSPSHPDQSGLEVGDAADEAGCALATAPELRRLIGNRCCLVFLNACESGREVAADPIPRMPGLGRCGLPLALAEGKGVNVVGTLGVVNRESASRFALEFYVALGERQRLGEALRLARTRFQSKYPDDITWALYVLYGDPDLKLF